MYEKYQENEKNVSLQIKVERQKVTKREKKWRGVRKTKIFSALCEEPETTYLNRCLAHTTQWMGSDGVFLMVHPGKDFCGVLG